MLFVFPLSKAALLAHGFGPAFSRAQSPNLGHGMSRADGMGASSGKLIPFVSFLHLANQEGMLPVPVTGGRSTKTS